MSPTEEKLTTKQQQAILALLAHPTIGGAAKSCGVAEETVYRWMKQAAFAAAYAQARRQAMEQGISLLQKATGSAVACLLTLMQDKDTPASARVSAASRVLEYAFKTNELLDVETRLQSIEEALAAPEGKQA